MPKFSLSSGSLQSLHPPRHAHAARGERGLAFLLGARRATLSPPADARGGAVAVYAIATQQLHMAPAFSLAQACGGARRLTQGPALAVAAAACAAPHAAPPRAWPRLPWRRGGGGSGGDSSSAARRSQLAAAAPLSVEGLSVAGVSMQGADPSGMKGHNQDRAVIVQPFGAAEEVLVGVMDGHGAVGHDVAHFLATHLPSVLYTYLSEEGGGSILGAAAAAAAAEDGLPERAGHAAPTPSAAGQAEPLAAAVGVAAGEAGAARSACWEAAFASADVLLGASGIDTANSGSTCTLVHLRGRELTSAWVGDSRTVLARRGEDGGWRAVPVSVDHDPARPDERLRITLCGGRVGQLVQPGTRQGVGPYRVWLSNLDWPGLAMSRAFGDMACRCVGVTAQPEVATVQLQDSDRWLVVASDGVWTYMSNEEVVDVVGSCSEATEAAQKLVRAAERAWRTHSRGYVDDITAVCVKLCPDDQ